MRNFAGIATKLPLFLLTVAALQCAGVAHSAPAKEVIGIWQATRNFGPVLRGPLTITRSENEWLAEIAGQRIRVDTQGNAISGVFPGGLGEFHGVLNAKADEIRGHWIQPATVSSMERYASPVTLTAYGKNRWRGQVVPLEDEFTFFLVTSAGEDGTVHAFLRNPDRNFGVFLDVDLVVREGDVVKLVGHLRNDKAEQVLAGGTYRPGTDRSQDVLSLYFRTLGATFDFSRADVASFFYARAKNAGEYHYVQPMPEDDGWPIGNLAEAGISEAPIKKLIETVVDPPATSVHDLYIHGILIARRGKLVFEDYFYGFNREKPHDTRSASKSLTATLVGSVIDHGAALSVSTPVYKTIYGDHLPSDLDPRKRAMTVENLLMMTSGYFCDDRNPAAPGNEDVMQSQTADPDWYHYTLNVPMISNPGEQPVYCSANPNLLGDVLSHATGKPLTELFQERIADPLQIKRYYLNLSPTGDPYMGGGIYWLPRDFMKLGQVMLNGGTWNGQRIVSPEWARRATAPLENLRKLQYGYLWWNIAYPYKGKTVRAFFAGGNGGQLVMGIPDLDLVVAFYAGNYSDPVLYKIQEELVPQYILPAIDAQN
ncbi:MAG TPA: serine hydrolase [Terriglobales bacterium]|nr:serine hydrolase [Terriglobales bacterium]